MDWTHFKALPCTSSLALAPEHLGSSVPSGAWWVGKLVSYFSQTRLVLHHKNDVFTNGGTPHSWRINGQHWHHQSIASGARLASLKPSRIFCCSITIECFIVLSGFVLQIKYHCVLFSPYLYDTNVIARYLYSLPQTSGTQIIFVYLRCYQDCL